MVDDGLERPKFLPSYIKAIGQSAERRGWKALVPIWLLVCGAFGVAAAYFIPASFWASTHIDVPAIVYTGILMLNGLILTLSWNAFARIYESISAPGFAAYLMHKKRMNGYIIYIGYVHIAQLVAIIVSAIGLVLLLDSIDVIYNRVAFAALIATSAYAIKTAASAVTVMHDLIWQKAIFDSHVASGGTVIPFGKTGE